MLQKVTRSTVIDAPIERVWAVLRDFNSHHLWHDVVAESRIEGDERSDQVGCVRSFTLKDGNRIREQLIALSDTEHVSTYCIVEATVPLQRYVATLRLKRVTDGDRTFWHWQSSFDTPPGQERELGAMVARDVYEAGFENLRRHLRQGGDLQRPSAGRGGGAAASAVALPARRVGLRQYGGPEVLEAESGSTPPPGPGEVRIRQRAVGVNFIDVYLRRGWMPQMLPLGREAAVPGMEAAGSVVDVGEGASGFLPGDRVAYIGPTPGAYASVRTVPAAWLVRLPAGVEDDTAAAILLKGTTADVLLRDLGHVGPGTRVLVHAAAGGLGLLLSSWAASLGATVIGTTSTDAKARVAREHGCRHVVVTGEYRFAEAVRRACGGADVIVDGLGEAARDENLEALAPCGHWISVGQASGALRPISPDALVAKSATFSRPVVFAWTAAAGALEARAARLWHALESGALKPPPIERWSLDAAGRARRPRPRAARIARHRRRARAHNLNSTERPMIQGMNHFTITAEDRDATLGFYCGLLGLAEGHRPDLGFPGAWLYADGSPQAVLHIYWDRPMPKERTGVIDHLAFTAKDLKAVKARFDKGGIAYDLRRQAGAGTWQLFSRDPNGAKVELDFDPAEESQ